ncbi:MAG: AMP-binding protein [Gammaproteobacteria bacterium]|nr:AMP-binding protein [Gammaproteobacteria bacterium]
MSALAELRENEAARKGALAPLRQIGLVNGIKTFTKTLIASRLKKEELGRQFILSYWDTVSDREAIIDGDNRITFGQFKDRTLRLADGLNKLGLKEGDAIAELLYNGPAWFEINLACTLTGIQMPMLNWHLKPKELAQCINAAQPKALLVDSEFLEKVTPILDQIPTVKTIIAVGDVIPDGMLDYEDIIGKASPILPPGKLDMAARPYSGGTTGTPKYMHINRERLASDDDSQRRGASKDDVKKFGVKQLTMFHHYGIGNIKDPYTHNVRSLIPGPLYHAGVQIGVLPFFLGGTVVPMRKFSAEGMLELIQNERIGWTFVAPTMLERILKLPEDVLCKYNLSTMRSIICAAAPCPPHVKQGINELFKRQGAPKDVFHEYYAASETGLVTILEPEDYKNNPERYKSVGKVRGCECQVWDAEAGKWAELGKEGKVIMRTPTVYGLEYAGVSEEDMQKNFIEVDGQLWYDDGLIGYLDNEDYLYLTSRVKEMIICGGVNLFPNEIENIIKQFAKVADVAVVRGPDKDLGEVPFAVVQLKEGETCTEEEILAFCKTKGLYGFKLPRLVEFGDLPRNLAGKLPKKDLEARFWEGVESYG